MKLVKGKDIAMHSHGTFTCRIPTDEALLAMKDLSSGAFKLLIYYYSKSTGWKFVDSQIAETLGVTEVVVKRLKKELIDKGYLYVEKGTNFNTYFIGRKAVLEWNNPDVVSESNV